jgi:DNA-binding transcriptional MerR regulator
MKQKSFFHKDVARLVGLSPRQVLSWTERGLVVPKKPARKAGVKREYSYVNLLEFGLARVLLDVIGVQFFTAKTILEELREDGSFDLWASDYDGYWFGFYRKVQAADGDKLVEWNGKMREGDFTGGTVDLEADAQKRMTPKKQSGTLYHIVTERDSKLETIRIVSPWDLGRTLEVFEFEGEESLREAIESSGMISVNLSRVKREIDERLELS